MKHIALPLAKYNSYCIITDITHQFKELTSIKGNNNRCRHHCFFESVEGYKPFFIKFKCCIMLQEHTPIFKKTKRSHLRKSFYIYRLSYTSSASDTCCVNHNLNILPNCVDCFVNKGILQTTNIFEETLPIEECKTSIQVDMWEEKEEVNRKCLNPRADNKYLLTSCIKLSNLHQLIATHIKWNWLIWLLNNVILSLISDISNFIQITKLTLHHPSLFGWLICYLKHK